MRLRRGWRQVLIMGVTVACCWHPRSELKAASLIWDIVSGDGSSITGGSGTWTNGLGNWNTGSSDTVWNNGTPDAAIFNGTAGTVTLGGAVTVGNITLNSGYTLAGGGNTLTLLNSTINVNTTATISATLGGSTGLIKSGTGFLTLSGANAYTGVTLINSGVLSVSTLANGGSNSNIGAASNDAANLVLNGGTLRYTLGAASAVSTDRLFSVGTSGGTLDASGGFNIIFSNTGSMGFNGQSGARTLTLTGSNANDNTLALVIGDNGGATSVTKTGGGVWLLSGANTYTGVTTVSGTAVLKVTTLANGGSASSIGASSNAADNLVLNGGTFTYTGGTVSTDRLFSLGTSGITLNVLGTGGVNFTNTGSMGFNGQTGARTLTLANSIGGTSTIAAVIGDNGGATSITRNNTGTWALTGANTYTGVTTLNGGTLSVTSLANGGTASNIGAATNDAANLVLNGGTLQYTGSGSSTDRLFSVGTSGGTLDSSGTGAVNFTNTGSMGFNSQSGTRTLTLTGSNTGSNILAAVIGDNGGATSLVKSGTGTWILTGNNTYTGTTTINGGTLALGSHGSSGSISGNIVNNGTLLLDNTSGLNLSQTISGTGGVTVNAGADSLSGTNTYTGVTSITGGVTLTVTNLANGGTASNLGASSSVAGNIVMNNGYLRYAGTGGSTDRLFSLGVAGGALVSSGTGAINFTNTGSIGYNNQTGIRNFTLTGTNTGANTLAASIGDNGGATILYKDGAGTWILTGANGFSGGTTISDGLLQVGNGGTSGALGSGAVINNSNLAFNRSDAFTVSNAISGTGTLTQSGTGTVTLSGVSTYTGVTVINAGVVKINTIANGGSNSNLGASTNAASNVVLNGGGLQYTGAGASTDRLFSVGTNGGTLDASGTGAVNFTNTGGMGFNGQTGARTLTLTGTNTGSNILAAVIGDNSGVTALAKAGAGTWVLTGTNTYTGTTTISAGVLQIGNGGTAGTLGSGAVTDNGSISFNRSDTVTIANTISGSGSLIQSGAGTTILTAANIYSGGTTISAGTLQVGNGGTTGTLGGGSITNNGTLIINRSDAITISGTMSGTGALIQNGTGTTTLSGLSNSWGSATVNAGILSAGVASGLGTTSAMIVNSGGTLATNGNPLGSAVGSISGSGIVQNGSSNNSGLVVSGNVSSTFSGVLQDGGTGTLFLTKMGAITTLTLSGSSTYTGPTTITGGTLSISTLADGGSASNIGASSNAASNLILNNSSAVLKYTGAAVSTNRLFSIGSSSGTLDASGTGAVNFTNTGSMGFNGQTGARTLTLTGTNTGANTLAAVIGDNGGATALTKAGAGTWVLTGTNTYTGVTTINGGVLTISSLANGGASSTIGASANAATNLVLNGGTLQYTGTGATTDKLFSVGTTTGSTLDSSGSGAVNFTNTGSMGFNSQTGTRTLTLTGTNTGSNTLAAAIGNNSGNTSLVKSGTGSWVLTGANTYGGTTTINAGTLQIGSGGTTGTLGTGNVTNNATLIFNRSDAVTVSNVISGTGSLIQAGTGTLTLSGTNTYTGATVINAGVVNANAFNNLGSSSSAATNLILNGGTLQFSSSVSTDRLFSVGTNGGGLAASGTGTVYFTNTGSMGFNGQTGTRTLNLDGNNTNDAMLAVAIGESGGATSLTKTGTGTWRLMGVNSYAGTTTISGGSLSVSSVANGGSSGNLGAATNDATNLVLNGGTLKYTGSGESTDRLFSVGANGGVLQAFGTGAIRFTNTGSMGFNGQTGARTLTLGGSNTGSNLLAAAIGDNGGATSVTVSSVGQWILSGSSTYTGATTIASVGGVLSVSSLANGGVSSNIGAASSAASNLVIDGASLLYTGLGASTDRLFSIGAGGGTIDSSGTGALNFTNSGSIGFVGTTVTRTFTLTGSNTGSNSLAAVIGESNGVTVLAKSGAGTWKLLGTNTYTGSTLVNAGTLQVGDGGTSGTLGAGGLVSISSGANLVFNRSDTFVVSNAINGNGSLAQSGTGTTILTGSNLYAGTTSINAGVLQIGNGGTAGALGSGAVTNNADLVIKHSDSVGISNLISGTGSFTAAGTGTVTLYASNSYTGATTISGGVLSVGSLANGGANSNIGASSNAASNLVLTGGTLAYAGTGATTDRLFTLGVASSGLQASGTGALTFTNAGNIALSGSGARTFILSGTSTSANTLAAALGDNGGATTLQKTGLGTWVLTGSSSYTGSTSVLGGVLTLSNLADGGQNSSIGAATSSAANLVINATLRYSGAATTTDRLFSIGTGAAPTLDASGTGAVAFTNTGSLGLNGSGTRTLTLTGTNTGSNTLAAAVGDNGGATSLTKSGSGTWVLAGANSYTGTTIISTGVLQIGSGGTSGTLGTGVVTNNAALVINRSDAVTLANSIGGIGSFTQAGSGTTTFTLSGSKSYTGATSVNAGKLQAGGTNTFSNASAVTVASGAILEVNGFNNSIGGLAGAGTVQNGAATGATLNVLGSGTSTFSGLIQDGGSGYLSLNKAGLGGTLTLTGSNTYTMGTVVTAGVLSVSTLANGGVASNIGAASNIASNLLLNGGTLRYTGAAVSTDRLFTVTTAGGTLDAAGTGVVSFTNTGSMGFNSESGARTLTLTGTGGGGAIAAVIGDNGGATSLTKTGAGQWALSGANGYTGITTITGGQLAASSLANGGSASGIGAATSAATNLILNGGVLRYTGAAVSTDRLFSVGTSGGTLDASGTGAVNFTNTGSMGFNGQSGARTLILNGSNTGNNTLAAIIGDNGGATSLIKLATSTWVLTGANTYTGSTRIDLGMLIISSLANGGVASNIGASSSAASNLILGLATLKYTGAATSTDRLFSVGTSGGTLDASGAGAVNFTNTGSMGFNSESGARVFFLQGSNMGSNTIAAIIGDNGGGTSIYKNGNGLWVLSGTNLYTGINLINAGTLSVAQLANGGTASNLGASTNAAANLVLNGGTLKYTGAAVSTDRLFSVGMSGGTLDASGIGEVNFTNTGSLGFNNQSGARTLTLTGTNAGNNTLAAVIGDNGGATSLVKSGAGSWVITGTNTYTGTTTISAGVLRVGNGGTSGTLGSGDVTDNGILVINHSNAITLANSISGSGSLVQQGAGTTTLTGANSYMGSTTISAGVLSVASLANGGSSSNLGASTSAATNLVLNGGTLQYTGATASTDRLFSVGTSGGTLDASGTGAVNFTNTGSMGFNSQSGTRTLVLTGTNTGSNILAAVIGDNGGATSLVKSGAGTWVLTGTNTYTGATTISAGVLQIGNGSTTGSVGSGAVTNNGSLVINHSNDVTLANSISGSGSVTQAGTGTTTLGSSNSYTGATIINSGVLNVTVFANGGGNSSIGAASSAAENLVINGGTLEYSGAADVSTDRLFSVGIGSAVIDVTGSGAVNFTNTGAMGFNGQSGDRNLLLTGTNTGVNIIAAAIGDFGGATSVTIDGDATWKLTGANTYTGATTLSAGVLQIGGSNLDSAIILGSKATLELNGLDTRIGSLAGSGKVQNNSTSAATLTTGGNNTSTTFSGVLQDGGTGALSLIKTGSGTFTLTGANSYTGTTTISGGVLQVGSGGTSGALGAGAVTNNASLVINRSNAILLTNDISGSGSFVQAGSGTTTLSGTNGYTGSTTINAGVLSVSVLANGGSSSNLGASTQDAANLVLNGGTLQYTGAEVSTDRLFSVGTNGGTLDASGTGVMNFTNTGSMGFNGQSGIRTLTLAGDNTGDNTLAAVIGDNGGATALTKSGAGTWVLTGANNYSGITTINDGVLKIGAGGTTGSIGSGAVINNGSLMINRSNEITLANGISGGGSLTQEGAGTTTLTGDSSYTGGTTINGGVLSVSVLADGGSNSNLGASTNAAANLVLNGGTLQYTGGDVSTDRLFSVGSSGATLDASGTGVMHLTNDGMMGFNDQGGARTLTLAGTNTGDNTLAAAIGDNGGASVLVKSGAGTWVLTGANIYTGTTTISAGELQIGSGGTTGMLGTGAVINNAALTINRSDAIAIANDISGSGVFTQAGMGTTTLSGDNSYGGSTTINSGVLSVSILANGGANSNLGASGNAAGNLVLNGGTLQYTGGVTSTDRLFSVGTSGGTLDASGTGAVNFTNSGSLDFNGQSGTRTLTLTGSNTGDNTLAAVIGDNGGATALTKSGTGTWVLTAANSYTGATTISGGTLQIGDGGTAGSLSTSSAINNNGTLVFNRSDVMTQGTDFAGVIAGSGGVTQAGGGTLTLNGDNTYRGGTNILSGTLEVTRNNALGTGDAGTTVSSGATLLLNNVSYSTSEALVLNGSGAGGGGALRNSGTSTYTGQITAETNASINAGGGVLNLRGGLVKDGTVLTFTGGGIVNVSGTGISGATASSDLVVDGTTLVVSADSDYNGPTTVQNGAALVANAAVKTTQLELSSNSALAGTGSITAAMNESIFINGTFSVGDPAVAATATSFALTTSGAGAVVMGAGSVIRLDLFSGAGHGNNLSNAAAADSISLHGQMDSAAGGTVVIGNPNGMTHFQGGDQWQLVNLNSSDANAGSITAQMALDDSSLRLASGVTSYLDHSTGIFSIIDTNGGLALAAVEGQALISAGNTVTSDLNGHLFNLRNGGGEESESGSIAASLDEGVIVGEGDGDPTKKDSPIAKRVARTRQWEVFATVNYGNVKLSPIRTQSGVQVDSWASGAGVERHLSRGLKLGFAASFLQSTQGYAGNLGSLYLEGPALSTYLSYVRGGFWNSLLYSFGTYQMDTTRNPGAPFPTAHGSTRTYTNSVQYNTGWNFRFQNNTLVTGPFVGVDYLHGSVNAYSETGGGLAALHYSAQSYQSLVSRVGWSASKQIKTRFATITPQLRLSYERQNIRNNNGTSVSLINVPFSSVGGGQTPGQDYLVAGIGVSLAFTDRFSLMLSYQGQFFRHDLQAHFGSIRFNYQF